ncbi:MAG: hypothetical protein LQ347_000014 [Umbilicaria vellea]|nr:MAG: hypothetical protein LQ347_000014 [Umbilicaria vellea]
MANASLLYSTNTFGSRSFDTHEAESAGVCSAPVSSNNWQPRHDLRSQRYKSRAQVNQARTLANTSGEKNPTSQSRLDTKEDRKQISSPEFLDVHRKYDARAEAMASGIALGSPGENPLPPLPVEAVANGEVASSYVSDSRTVRSVGSKSRDACVKPVKTRTTRWHTLHGIFSKKTTAFPPSPNLPVLQMKCSSVWHAQQDVEPLRHQAGPSSRNGSPQRTRSAGDTGSLNVAGPHVRRLPNREVRGLRIRDFANAKPAPLPKIEIDSPRPPPKDINYNNVGPGTLRGRIDSPPRLHVEIPNVEMERYSVMFGSVLDETQPLSLLARRHGLSGKLTNVAEVSEVVRTSTTSNTTCKKLTFLRQINNYDPGGGLSRPARRATSPTTKSPSFSLFPSTSPCSSRCPAKAQLYRPSPLQRAATPPDALSPDEAATNLPQTDSQVDNSTILHSPETASASSRGQQWSWGTSHLSQVSSDSSLDERDPAPEVLFKQIPSMNVPRSKFNDQAFPTYLPIIDKEGGSSNAPGTHKASPPLREVSKKATNVAEVLVARQISISAQQRRLLSNLVPKTARQPMHPVLVDVRNGPMVRNSHHVLLEEI